MVKKMIILAVCFMLSAVAACAQRDITFIKRDSVEIVMKDAPSFEHQRFVYGLYKGKKELLPMAYDMVENYPARLLVFFKDTQMLVYDTNGNLIDKTVLEYPIDRHSTVEFEEIDTQRGEKLYELMVYYNDNSWIYQPIGVYCRKGNHLYKVRITMEYELIK